ncbi:hypothetical protein CW304_25485 [Bacillus sp. UFRGS-B20]|nr:hypothetical protein CW304_25485 [Bacillus sp. UFRGS-B20]
MAVRCGILHLFSKLLYSVFYNAGCEMEVLLSSSTQMYVLLLYIISLQSSEHGLTSYLRTRYQ